MIDENLKHRNIKIQKTDENFKKALTSLLLA